MRLSISNRVSLACVALVGLSLLLLLAGLNVGIGIRRSNAHVEALSRALQADDVHAAAQQQLRLSIGALSRRREQGLPVSPPQWSALTRQIDTFERFSHLQGEGGAADSTSRETHNAALEMVGASRRLAAVSQDDPSRIKQVIPAYLKALKRLERAQLLERGARTQAIGDAVRASAAQNRREIARVLIGGLVMVLIITAMGIWLRSQLLSPIASIATRLREFNADAKGGHIPGLTRADELGDLARGLAEYRAAVEERRVAERKADYLARHDVLTGLANRLQFEDSLARQLEHSRATGATLALLAVDMDNFKAINDRHGHVGGDRALKRAADILSACAGEKDLVARVGGDEFAILQIDATQPAAAEALAASLLESSRSTAQEAIEIHFSIGMAIAAGMMGREELHNAADLALYRAKSDGRDRARLFDAELQEREQLRVRLARELEHAIEKQQLRLVYQPIADATSLRVIGYEALLRWSHPSLGHIAPDVFIPVAESSGLIDDIGLWVADQAFAAAAEWEDGVSLSLNLSPLQFRKPGFAQMLLYRAQRHGMPIARLELEVTENAMLLGVQRSEVLDAFRLLQGAGARIVMDDFGTGHLTLRNLKDFAFDKLKIDRSFIAELHDHESSALIVKTTIALAKSLGQKVVAEGVETPAQLAELKLWGCDQIQGYLIGRPAPDPGRSALPARASLSLAR